MPRNISAWERHKEVLPEGQNASPMSKSADGQDEDQELSNGFGKIQALGDLRRTCFPGMVSMEASSEWDQENRRRRIRIASIFNSSNEFYKGKQTIEMIAGG